MRGAAAVVLAAAACGGAGAPATTPTCSVCAAETPVPPAVAAASDVRVEGALRFDGVPALEHAIADDLRPYLDARSADLLDVRDDGALLITTRFGDTRQLHRVDRAGGDRQQLTFAREPISQGRWVPGDDDGLLMIVDHGGDEQYQLWRVDGADEVRLTDGTSRNVSPVWSADGAKLAWSSTARNGKDFDIWIGDGVTAASAELVYEASGDFLPLEFSDDGTELLVSEFWSRGRSQLHRLELATGAITRLSDEEGEQANPVARYGSKGRIYAVSDRHFPNPGSAVQHRRQRLWEIPSDGSGWIQLTRKLDNDVEALDVSPDGKTVAFVVNVNGASQLRLLDTRSRKHRVAAGVPTDGVIGGFRFVDDRRLALSWSSATTVGDAFVYDLKKRTLVRWTESELAGVDAQTLVSPRLDAARSFDGFTVPMWIYPSVPAGGGRAPVILDLHGGPESQSRPKFQPFVQFLVARGYTVIQPNVRGSTGYGRDYMTADDGILREDAVRDVGAVLDWIATQGDLDPARVGVMGQSYGGYLTLASLVHHGARLRAGVDMVGISSFVTFLENTSAYRRDLRRAEYGDERDPAIREFLIAASPLTRAAEITTPLFVLQGANDPRVPASEAEQIVAAVRATGAPVWYLLADNEGHGFARQENKEAHQVAATMFFAEHL